MMSLSIEIRKMTGWLSVFLLLFCGPSMKGTVHLFPCTFGPALIPGGCFDTLRDNCVCILPLNYGNFLAKNA